MIIVRIVVISQIRKVNLILVYIVVEWIFFFNKYMIQNPVFLGIILLCYLLFTQLSCGLILT